MIRTATALTSACASRGSGPNVRPDDERRRRRRRSRSARTRRTRYRPGAGSARASAAPRSPSARSARAACRCRPARAFITNCPVPLTVPPVTWLARRSSRPESARPVTIDSSTALVPSSDDAVHRHASRRVGRAGGRRRAPGRAARPRSAPSGSIRRAVFGARPSRCPDRGARSAARAQLEHLAEQDERRR